MSNHRIQFLPDSRDITVAAGQTLLEAAQAAEVFVDAVCGGEGGCGKCRVIVRQGKVQDQTDGRPSEFLTQDEIDGGYVLACQTIPLTDVVVEAPPESQLVGYQGLGGEGAVSEGRDQTNQRFRDFAAGDSGAPVDQLAPLVRKSFVELAEPTIDNPTADRERLLEALSKEQPGPLSMAIDVTRSLPRALRRCQVARHRWSWTWGGRVTATLALRENVQEVIGLESGDTSRRLLGLALDIGTTTVVAHLVDLTSGKTLEAAAKYNSQIKFGADVINRINHARRPGGADGLRQAVVDDVNTLLAELVDRAGIKKEDIACVVVGGNTTMLHLLVGLEADLIRLSPFVPVATSLPALTGADLGLEIHPRGPVYPLPMVGSFVGGDITAGILVSGLHESERLSLFLDIGTNGEVVLGNRDFMVACAASAGPAFEGGSVSCGMRAARGAIDGVRISSDDWSVTVSTIENAPPVGLCGTGMIQALAEMLLAGIVNRSGRFQVDKHPERFRPSETDGGPLFTLVEAEASGNGRPVVISEPDIENLILTKGSIYAAADSLVESVGLSFADVEQVFLAGAFGNKLDIDSCITIGLLPELPAERIRFIGNSCVAGAKMALLDRKKFDDMHRMRDQISYQELMVDPGYMDKLTSASFLPHTDLARFPSVTARLENKL